MFEEVVLTVTSFSLKMLISTRCIHGFMPNLIKGLTVSVFLLSYVCFDLAHFEPKVRSLNLNESRIRFLQENLILVCFVTSTWDRVEEI